MPNIKSLTYREAGVDIAAGDALVNRIKPHAARTWIPELLEGVGGFAGLCGIPGGMREPVMVSGTDGVGTKLKLAFMLDRHDTIGIDLVAMCVNDVITTGARPMFFLDYFATGRLDVARAEAVIAGIARGCEQAHCALLGGETAEMPGFYKDGEYDLAGFSVGVVEKSALLGPRRIDLGDRLIALPSSGLHSNGYSLARKALFEVAGHDATTKLAELEGTLGDALLTPTKIYASAIAAALEVTTPAGARALHAAAHITGGGISGNLPRVLPRGTLARVTRRWHVPPIFHLIQRAANVDENEMEQTFNMGVGMILVVDASAADAMLQAMHKAGERAVDIGSVEAREEEESDVEGLTLDSIILEENTAAGSLESAIAEATVVYV